MSNPLPWPEIGHFPDYCCSLVEAHLRFRAGDPKNEAEAKLRRLSTEEFHSYFFDLPWSANIKYDGTNVGISKDGALYGRRRKIGEHSYQKTDVRFLKEFIPHILNLEQSILGSHGEKVSQFFVYGELMCNHKYDYEDKSLLRQWVPFGVCFHVPDVDHGKMVHQTLLENGFSCNAIPKVLEGEITKVTILLNEKLQNLFRSHNLPAAETLCRAASLYELAMKAEKWLVNGNGEGLVCITNSSQKKWKIGNEKQTSIFDTFKERVKELAAHSDVDPRVFEVTDIIFKIKDSRMIMGNLYVPVKKNKQAKSKQSLFEHSIVHDAIISGLTKYDSLEVYFSKNERNDIINALIEEVEHDILSDEEGEHLAKAKQELANAVKKFVGVQFGKWKFVN